MVVLEYTETKASGAERVSDRRLGRSHGVRGQEVGATKDRQHVDSLGQLQDNPNIVLERLDDGERIKNINATCQRLSIQTAM